MQFPSLLKLLIFFLVIFVCLPVNNSAYAASGTIMVAQSNTGGTLEVTSNFAVSGTYTLTSDDTIPTDWTPDGCNDPNPRHPYYYWDGDLGIGTYAVLRYKLDGIEQGQVDSVDCGVGGNTFWSQLGETKSYTAAINISDLDPSKEHEVTLYLQDIYGVSWWNGQSCSTWDMAKSGDIIASKTVNFRIKVPQECKLNTPLGSSANVNTGNLSDQLDLFSFKGNGALLGFSLYYNSIDSYPAGISQGWNHNFEYRLVSNPDGNMLLMEPNGSRRYYQPDGQNYISQAGDTSILQHNSIDGSFTVSETDGSSMSFTQSGMLKTVTDRYGNTLTLEYDETISELWSVKDGTRQISFEYDYSVTPHRLYNIHTSMFSYMLRYDTNGRLWKVIYPVTDVGISASYWQYTYTTDGKLESKRDPVGNQTRYHYDTSGRVDSSTLVPAGTSIPEQPTRSIEYPTTAGNVRSTIFTEKDGGQWTYTYDVTSGRLLEKIAPDDGVTPLIMRTTSYTHYSDGRTKSRTEPGTDGIRYTTFYSYDANGNVITESIPLDCTALAIDPATVSPDDPRLTVAFRYSYDLAGDNRILSQSDERDPAHILTTGYAYTTDAEGYQVTTVTSPANAVTVTRQYDDGRIRDITDANGKKTSYGYRTDKQIESVTDPAGAVTYYSAYDGIGNNTELQIKDSDGVLRKTVRMQYDARSRLRKSTTITDGQPDIVTGYNYDGNDNLNSLIDAEQHETKYVYDYNHQVTKTTDANNNDTIFEYGGGGCTSCGGGGVDKLTTVYDAKFSKNTPLADQPHTSFSYDKQGRLEYETDPIGKKFHYTYHENGKVKEKYDATNLPETLLITYSYDNRGQLLNKRYNDGTPDEGYTYDTNGRLQTAYNGNIGYSYAYHLDGPYKGRLKSVTDNNGKQNYYDEYDNLGQRLKVTRFKGSPDERIMSYLYDYANRPWTITSSAGTFTYLYDKLGRRDTLTYPHAVTATYKHDNLDRLTSLKHTASAATVAFVNYSGFDKVGNRKSRISSAGTESYVYDSIYRLVNAITPKGTENYIYDSVGNRIKGPGGKDIAYQHDAANRMTHGRLMGYDYDNAGNQITKTIPNTTNKGWMMTWDLENRLTRMEKSKGTTEKKTISYKYDPFGRRIEKKYESMINGVTKTSTWSYFHDEDNIAMEIHTAPVGTPEKTFYTAGAGTDEHLAMERGGQNFYFHADGLGSITAITDSNKVVVQSYGYDSFGAPKSSTGFRNPYLFTGREWDKETGLYFNRARYYDPLEGRFVSRDPIGFNGGINVYAYTGNNPVNFTDPEGLSPVSKLVQLSSKYWGKIMIANLNTCKKARVKIYKDKNGKNNANIKVFADGSVEPAGTNLPKDVIDKAVQLLQGIVVFTGEFVDPFGATEAE